MNVERVSANEVLSRLHQMIDVKLSRKKRSEKVCSIRVKYALTLFAISNEFLTYDPEQIMIILKQLVKEGRIVTNIDEQNVNPFDAYFIPKSEI
ncbi:hypothetical protein [Sphingobacterium sp. BIGb0116]|uniref:hypothetical protein n=1 Tax=Sphingobacterium sp. BIGb0116 TaxID=2940619 RepID=UPI0021687C1B|nr:hypothetical protein [Sphingobacterium sp. BIGb0116]MCS4164438.1 hypothetical protein [Sphingobacterium sp. BIGb0116]